MIGEKEIIENGWKELDSALLNGKVTETEHSLTLFKHTDLNHPSGIGFWSQIALSKGSNSDGGIFVQIHSCLCDKEGFFNLEYPTITINGMFAGIIYSIEDLKELERLLMIKY